VLPPDGDAADRFQPLRPGLVRLAYRMLGSIAEAEDVVQEAYIRWHQTDRSAIREPGAFLSKTVTRLCLDILKSARVKRETYIGPWLPEPVLEAEQEDMSEDLSLTLMMALERLSPLERAAFLLHDVFGLGFDEVATTLDRGPGCLPPARGPRERTSARTGRAMPSTGMKASG
jgi:RNA polymerase sigma-70 factor (ECF subfamily)